MPPRPPLRAVALLPALTIALALAHGRPPAMAQTPNLLVPLVPASSDRPLAGPMAGPMGVPEAAAAAGSGTGSGVTASEVVGHLVGLRGAAGVRRDDVSRPARPGMAVHLGDRLLTSEQAMLVVSLEDGARLTLGPASDLTLSDALRSRDGFALDATLNRGAMRVTIHRGAQWAGLTVHTPVVAATLRMGTAVVETSALDTAVYSRDARVQVTDGTATAGATVGLLGAGMGIDVRRGEPAARPMPWAESVAAPLLARTDLP